MSFAMPSDEFRRPRERRLWPVCKGIQATNLAGQMSDDSAISLVPITSGHDAHPRPYRDLASSHRKVLLRMETSALSVLRERSRPERRERKPKGMYPSGSQYVKSYSLNNTIGGTASEGQRNRVPEVGALFLIKGRDGPCEALSTRSEPGCCAR